jgi:ubiquinone/menaquinone biosynthesis C-methylase UbiE
MKIDFNKRSYEKEMMDDKIESIDDLFVNLKELELINIFTGGRHTCTAIKKLMTDQNKSYKLLDIGFGAGDMLAYILKKKPNQGKFQITAVDIMPEAKAYIDTYHADLKNQVNFKISDYKMVLNHHEKTDIAYAGLFCHHFNDEELVEFFKIVQQNCTVGAVINDLQRSPFAYYGIKILVSLFSKSPFTKNDAPLSVLRGFTKRELIQLLEKASVKHYSIQWKWAFRYVITIYGHG